MNTGDGWNTERCRERNAWTSGKYTISLKHRSMPAHHNMCDGSHVGLIRMDFSRKFYMSWHWEVWFNSTVSTWFFDSKTQSHLSHLTALSQKGNILLPIWTLPRDHKTFHHKEKIVTIWWSFHNIYQIIRLYTWNQNNIICQYYLCIMIPETEIAYLSMWLM